MVQPTVIHIGSFIFQVSDVINAVLLAAALIGLAATIGQVRQGSKIQRATFFKELYLTLSSDDMLKSLSLVEDDKIKLANDGDMLDGEQEVQLNRLLGFANTVCALWQMKLISSSDMWNFHYLLARLYRHAQVRKYSVFLTTYETKYVPFKNGPVYAEFVVYCAKSLGLGPIEGIEAEIESYRMRDDQATRGVT